MYRIAIHGRCLARDTVEFGLTQPSELCYAARQSIVSVYRPVKLRQLLNTKLQSAFQNNNFQGDLAGDALQRILRFPHSDILLIDLIDERLGFYLSADGQVATCSIDGMVINAYDDLGWKHVKFGTLTHFLYFTRAWLCYVRQLKQAELFHKTVVLQSSWALKSNTGQIHPVSVGLEVQGMDKKFRPYFWLMKLTGVHILKVPDKYCITDEDHVWGPAPYHYIKPFYKWAGRRIEAFIQHKRRFSPSSILSVDTLQPATLQPTKSQPVRTQSTNSASKPSETHKKTTQPKMAAPADKPARKKQA
ncbi:MAG: DUF6270 domain-containing protein [Actinomycetaceae bacterium]|nr:DUF6270 domain-containing protein [Actinomycetaceae bacterium]